MQTAKGTATELPQFPLQRLPRITLQKFYILGMRGSAEVCFPPRWRLCRWTAVQQPHPTPTPPPVSLHNPAGEHFNESLAMWFRSSWQSMEIFFKPQVTHVLQFGQILCPLSSQTHLTSWLQSLILRRQNVSPSEAETWAGDSCL